jgi:pimeloyl-ACP methyl ester carboxylesterase
VTDYPSTYRSKLGYEKVMALNDEALQQGPVPYQTRMINTRHGKTHIVIGGPENGRPIVLFHGWSSFAATLGVEFPFLFNAFRVYMPDIIGQTGKSDPNRPPTKGSVYADWVADILNELNLQKAIVMGVSGGGWITLKFAAYYPDRITKAIAISTAGLSPQNFSAIVRGMLPAAIFPNSTTIRWLLDFFTAPTTQIGDRTQALEKIMKIQIKYFKSNAVPGQLSEWELRQITAPLLILMGEYERIFFPIVSIERAKQYIPGLVSAELVANAGHIMTTDQPEWMHKRILDFLAD